MYQLCIYITSIYIKCYIITYLTNNICLEGEHNLCENGIAMEMCNSQ